MTFIISEVRGEGDDAFVILKTVNGGIPFGWFRAEQLRRPAHDGQPDSARAAKQEEMTMSDKQNADARTDPALDDDRAGARDHPPRRDDGSRPPTARPGGRPPRGHRRRADG